MQKALADLKKCMDALQADMDNALNLLESMKEDIELLKGRTGDPADVLLQTLEEQRYLKRSN